MNKFDTGDFLRYFDHSWIISPELKRPVLVTGSEGSNFLSTFREDIVNVRHLIPLVKLVWEHCAYPVFGYVNWTHNRQKIVVLVEKLPQRTIYKGLNRRTLRLTFPEGYYVGNTKALASLPLELDQKMVEALYTNTFPSIEDALRYMTAVRCYGIAVDKDWAITLGPTEEETYVLHFKGCVVASGNTIEHLNFSSPYVQDAWVRWRNAQCIELQYMVRFAKASATIACWKPAFMRETLPSRGACTAWDHTLPSVFRRKDVLSWSFMT
jgi:hypothetical protein